MAVYALLVGVNDYQGGVPLLRGAVRDVEHAAQFLGTRVAKQDLHTLVLTDDAATRAAVVDGFRSHLAAAGPSDAALFWFAGHGSRTPVPVRFAPTEPSGFMQTLVCADSRTGDVPDLLDKELGLLLSEVAARGAHAVAVLDCCYSGGADRDVPAARLLASAVAALGVRWAPPAARTPPGLVPDGTPRSDLLPPGPARPVGGPAADHVSLAACQTMQVAHEIPTDGGHRGVFGLMLLRRLAEGATTYRELIAQTRCLVESEVPGQHPALYPEVGALPDTPFLGGPVIRPRTAMTMRHSSGVWHIDAGALHGLAAGSPRDPTLLDLHDDPQRRRVRVVGVRPDRSVVEPVGWRPADTGQSFPVVLTRTPVPPAAVAVDAAGGQGARLVADAVRGAGPAGAASPHLVLADPADPGVLPELRVAFPQPGRAVITACDGTPLDAARPCAEEDEARDLVRRLEHVVRWRRIRALDNPGSGLAGAVSLEVVEALPGELDDPRHRPPLAPDGGGAIRLAYRRAVAGWAAPGVFLRLRNVSHRDLYCVVLDLTDRFRMHPYLFDGGWVAPGEACANGGALVAMTLPPGREPTPGARGTDWFKVLAAETPIDAGAFLLPRLGEPRERFAGPPALRGVLEQLAWRALHGERDLPPTRPRALDWTTSTTTVVTAVPCP